LISSAVFAQITAERPYTLQWTALYPQNCPFLPGHPSNAWFLGRIQAHNPNSISIGSAIFPGCTMVTDRPRYSVS